MKTSLLLILTFISIQLGLAQSTITISPDKDNTLYESASGDISNGAGDYLFFGRTNGGDLRRTLLSFDLSSNLQPGDSITDISLTFQVSKVPSGSPTITNNFHRVSQNWGEGSSNAGGEEGTGITASIGDATWTEAFFGGIVPMPWNNAGGDFDSNPSASIVVAGTGSYSVSSAQMIVDAQTWLNSSATNFGWIIIGDESLNKTAKRINSRENATNPVSLDVTFIRPVALKSISDKNSIISVFPNPVSSTFELKNAENLSRIEILDLSGKSRRILNPESTEYNIADLDRGIYLLKLQLGEKSVTQKLIKQ